MLVSTRGVKLAFKEEMDFPYNIRNEFSYIKLLHNICNLLSLILSRHILFESIFSINNKILRIIS